MRKKILTTVHSMALMITRILRASSPYAFFMSVFFNFILVVGFPWKWVTAKNRLIYQMMCVSVGENSHQWRWLRDLVQLFQTLVHVKGFFWDLLEQLFLALFLKRKISETIISVQTKALSSVSCGALFLFSPSFKSIEIHLVKLPPPMWKK